MANAVVPRMQGDDYQARFFWWQACRLFQPHTKVARVGYELNTVKSFDDVVVTYTEPLCSERGDRTSVDYYQVKFHVNQAGAFTWQALMSPEFIGATRFSLLQRLYDAQRAYAPDGGGCRFIIVSPWSVHPDDPLAKLISNNGGEFRLHVLFDGTGPNSMMGRIRRAWREHLGLAGDEELANVLRPLRINKSAPDLAGISDLLNTNLLVSGFVPVEAGTLVHPYDDLVRKLFAQGTNEFTREHLQKVAQRENLWVGQRSPPEEEAAQLGIRSFMRWAENMEDETEAMLCLVPYFDNRDIRERELWQSAVFPGVQAFLQKHTIGARSYHLMLDTHSSIAFAAGYCLEAKSGIDVVPVQRMRGKKVVWRPQPAAKPRSQAGWSHADYECNSTGHDVALAISVTHDVSQDVKNYVSDELPQVGRIMSCTISPRPGSTSVQDATHALDIVQELLLLVKRRSSEERSSTLHIFAAAPNLFMFFLGRLARGLGKCMLYEFDFDTCASGAYHASISFPPPPSATTTMSPASM